MPIKPGKDETQSDWMGRCVPKMMGENGGQKRPQEQAVAACMTMWRDKDKKTLRTKQDDDPVPRDDEEFDDWMDRCGEDLDDDECRRIWEENNGDDDEDDSVGDDIDRNWRGLQTKTHEGKVSGLEFVLSDDTPDRLDDIIEASGWELKNFKKNPVALFNHSSDFPIGKWRNLRVEKNELRGHLELAPEGTSPRIDEIRKLIDVGILKAVSVGFRPLEHKRRSEDEKDYKGFGHRFIRSELVETSVVAVPANANALAVAKSLKISPQTIELVFAEKGAKGAGSNGRGPTGEHANTSRIRRGSAMSGLAQRIAGLETNIVAKRDALQDHLDKMDDSNVSDADLETRTTLISEIRQLERTRESLVESEKLLTKNLLDENGHAPSVRSRALTTTSIQATERVAAPAVIANPKKELTLLDLLVRSAVVTYLAKTENKSPGEVRQRIYGDEEGTHVMTDIVTRAASAPAMTTVTGWAAELVRTQWTDLMPILMPLALLTRLAPKGLTLSFGQTGRIIIPTRSRTPSLAGSFVGEGMAIPVRQGMFTSQTLTPKKMAVISTWTREMGDHSIPAIEGLIREAIQQDTSVAIDSVLIDTNPATTIRPAGLLNGLTGNTPTAGGGLLAVVGDASGLIQTLQTGTYGNVRSPAWLMNPTDVLRVGLSQATTTGIFPLREEVARGTLFNIPIIDSVTVPPKTMILIDAADFVVVGGEAPRMEMSDQATLHMEDTSPQDLVISPSTVAAPQKSLFQTDSLALRMIMPLNWTQRRAGTVAFVSGVTW
jgi:HK97 family phage prohead protease/HK97 family phage major capsid protein